MSSGVLSSQARTFAARAGVQKFRSAFLAGSDDHCVW